MNWIATHLDSILFALAFGIAVCGYFIGKQTVNAQLESDVRTVLDENEQLREVILQMKKDSRFLSGNSAGSAIRQARG